MRQGDGDLEPVERELQEFFEAVQSQEEAPKGLWQKVEGSLDAQPATGSRRPRRSKLGVTWMAPVAALAVRNWSKAAAVAAVLVGVGVGLGLVLLTAGEREEAHTPLQLATKLGLGLELRATDENAKGVGPETHFVLTSRTPLTAEQVAAAIDPKPTMEFRLDPVSSTEFHVVPLAPLAENTVYHVTYRPEETGGLEASWAFQVRSPLRVVGTLPAHEVSQVPLASGIEITFSHDGIERPEDYIEITPRVDGHFEQHKRTIVFVPEALEPETVYTVTVRAGVGVAGSDLKLENDTVFQFETEDGRGGPGQQTARLDFLHRVSEAGTSEPPLVSVVTGDTTLQTMPVEVFAYATLDMFIGDLEAREAIPVWAVNTRARSNVDTSRLQPVTSFDATIEGRQQGTQPQGFFGEPRLFFRLPGALPVGLYLLQADYRGERVQAWLQITDVATYLALSETSTLVWVNDVSTGQPLANARVEVIGHGEISRTDGEGIASFVTPDYLHQDTAQNNFQGARSYGLSFIRVSDDQGRQAIVPLSPVLPPSLMSGRCGAFVDFSTGWGSDDYWTFIATDRPMYLPEDTVRFWGIAKSRDEAPERELRAVLRGYSLSTGTQRVTGTPVALRTSDLGTFEAELSLDGVEPGYYNLSVYDGDVAVTSTGFRVEHYIKPAYSIALKPERPAYFGGEQVNVEIEAVFFDGTPVPGLELRHSTKDVYARNNEGILTTGPDGKARFSFTAPQPGEGNSLHFMHVGVVPAKAEEAEIGTETGVAVFGAELQIQTQASYQDGVTTVTGHVRHVDPALYTPMVYSPFGAPSTPEHLTNPAPGRTVSLSVTENLFEPVEIGRQYDYINKVSQPVYRYEYREGAVTEATVTTDPEGRFSFSFPSGDRRSYTISANVQDDSERSSRTRVDVYGMGYGFDSGTMAYLATEDQQGAFFFARAVYELGDPFSITFRRGTTPLPSGGENRYLFYEGQRGIRHYEVQDNPVYRTTFSERHIPSATIGGVYFNGFTYIEAQYGPTLQFNPENRRLDIEIRSVEESYSPGEVATVEVVVRDGQGRPVEAEVNLAAVDEAFFAAAGHNWGYQASLLASLYRSLPSGIIRTYASHQYPPQLQMPGGRGGDGGDGVREEFPDVAMYETVRTDASGRAQVSFKTPDNLTSWRISAYAVTGDLLAGEGTGSVVVNLPFFVDVSLNEDYLRSDKPLVGVRAFGTALRGDEAIEFQLTTPSLTSNGSSVQARPFEQVELPLPPLTLGEHEVMVEARVQGSSMADAVRQTIRVVESRIMVPEVAFYETLGSNQRIEGARDGPTTVTFMDAGRGQLYPMLQRLRWSYGDRVDQALARAVAGELLARYFGEVDSAGDGRDWSGYMRSQGGPNPISGVAILPYASPDLAVTARIADLAPDLFGRDRLRTALEPVANDIEETPERQAIALYGLAALDEPVLLDTRALALHPDLNWRGMLYVALALEAMGDHPGASQLLQALLDRHGEDIQSALRLRVGTDQDDVLEATALAAGLAAGLGDERAASLLRYVQNNATDDILLFLEELSFAEKALQSLGARPVSFAYTIEGVRQEVTLERGETLSLGLSPKQLASLRVDVQEGSLSASTVYRFPLSQSGLTPSDDVGISRSIRVDGREVESVSAGELVEVRLDFRLGPQAPQGCYQISDLLPSGLKPVTRPATFRAPRGPPPGAPGHVRVYFPYLSEGQRVSFCLTSGDTTSVTYYARPSGKGEFTWEAATIHNQRYPGVIGLSNTQTIRIE